MLTKDYYLTLGISRGESAQTIRQAFCEQLKRYHPERVGIARRRFFDRSLSHSGLGVATHSSPIPPAAGVCGLPQVSPVLRAHSIFIASIFDAALARVSRNLTEGTADERKSPVGLDVQVVLSAAEALKGGIVQMTVPSCSPCHQCGGAGREGLFPCDLCDGEGSCEETETLRVRVPANFADQTHINVPLRGLGPHNFYLCVRIRVAG
jgi:hypothetical protein